ncbi:MAG: hypothetical protein D8M57_13175 [Candidatus Scalindua sp. AMX11]|nr:MAG: hypothetical protein DWQ00_11915 [Candidatus Scalindua sp.]NOG83774.1 hypothetical protein [Planctomycetota bacterium]RZV82931.1 MAG: hypothetical protein EX341_09070 [Candidatus Scalindua sp. SCAELEC01]TDE64447.1 MAG: hypothetical protein D8M57_13175 [Candidatus Scalindua sp. AMX11]GJQ59774.1 MAG: hypothetical protein SCALA701_25750 [Candidatus Scalindua sp.]
MGNGLLTFEFDVREIDALFDDMSSAYQKAAVNTLNKVGRGANREAAKFIKSNYNIPAKALKISGAGRKVILKRADARRAFVGFTINVLQSRRGLMLYGAKKTAKGVRVRVKKKTKNIKGAFISTWRRGDDNKFVFVRDPKEGFYKKGEARRTKRRTLLGPSIADLYGSRRVRRLIDTAVRRNFQKELDEQFNNQFEKRR